MPKKKLTKRGSKRREELLQAAYRLLSEDGYHGTTVGDICDEIGVGKGVFYWYFRSKEEIFREILRARLLHLRRAQEQAIEGVDSPIERLERGIRASIDFYRNSPGDVSLIRTASRYDEFSGVLNEGQETVVADTAVHVKEGMAAGDIRHGDPALMAHGILGAIQHFVEVYLGGDGRAVQPRPQLADEAVAFCLRGVLER